MRLVIAIASLTFAAVLGGCAAQPADGEQTDDSNEINGGTVTPDAPSAVVRIGTFGCSGVAIAPKVVLTAAQCIENPDLINAGGAADSEYVRRHVNGEAEPLGDKVRHVTMIKGKNDEPVFALLFVGKAFDEPLKLPARAIKDGTKVVMYGFGADEERENIYATLDHVQSREIEWGKRSSVAGEDDIGGPLVQGDTVVGLVMDRHGVEDGIIEFYRGIALGTDVMIPLVPEKDGEPDTSLVDAIRDAIESGSESESESDEE